MTRPLPPRFCRWLCLFSLFGLAPAFSQEEKEVTYETPPALRSSELFDDQVLVGPHHRVRDEVKAGGSTHTFTIESDFGMIEAHGNDRLLERIKEIYAIAAIRETKETEAYQKALEGAARETADGAVDLITNPVDSVVGAGKGAVRLIKGAKERVRVAGEGGKLAEEMKKYGPARREIAGRYGVDPYTSNELLRTEIDSLAKAVGAGDLTFTLIKSAIPGGVGTVVSGVSKSASLNDKLIAEGPFALRAQNRERLEDMGIPEAQAEEFLDHTRLNPRHQTVITYCLELLGDTRGKAEFLRVAMTAESEQDAYSFQRLAELLAAYHRHRSPVREIAIVEGRAVAVVENGRLVLPQLLDYGIWTEEEALLSQALLAYSRPDLEISGVERVITGVFTSLAKTALADRGIKVLEQADEALVP